MGCDPGSAAPGGTERRVAVEAEGGASRCCGLFGNRSIAVAAQLAHTAEAEGGIGLVDADVVEAGDA
jgi:hypothetical protein